MRITLLGLVMLSLASARLDAQRERGIPKREAAERRLQQQIGRAVQERLALDDSQMQKLQAVNQRFEGQRRTLLREERGIRVALRTELAAESRANQARVGELIDRALRVQRERLDLLDAEQRELAAFLTPVQRAKYLAMQEQIRRRLDDLRRDRSPGGGAAPARKRGPPS
jgi:hypothetical protein